METKIIARVNNVDIVSTSDEQELISIKTVCNVLHIGYEEVLKGIESDDFAYSVTVHSNEREENETYMPLMYLIGWIFADYVTKNARPGSVMELHKALYEYLEKRNSEQSLKLEAQRKRIEELEKEIAELEQSYKYELDVIANL